MNSIVIVLGIILIILVYVLYKYFTVSSTTLVPSASLTAVIPAVTAINSPKNVNYAYGVWLYVNTWDKAVNKNIFTRNQNIKLSLDKTSPTLKCDIYMNDSTWKTINITDNFPIQKWVYIIISVDNQFIDCYLDGKLVASNQLTIKKTDGTFAIPATPLDIKDNAVFLGNSDATYGAFTSFDAYVTKFNRWTSAVDPQTAWNAYMEGNGKGSASVLGDYGINMTILQNNVQQGTYSLL